MNETIGYANDENEAVGNFLLKHRDGNKILSAVMNTRYPKARDLEKLVIKYHKTRGIPNWEFEDDDDGGIDWVTFDDLFLNLIKNESFTNEKKGEFLSSLFPKVKVDKAIKIAKKMKGNMTGAVKAIEKFFPGMSKHNDVQDALRKYNESVNEVQKRQATDIAVKFDKAYLNFSREIRDIIKMVVKITGNRTDGKIFEKSYTKHLIPFDALFKSWYKGQQDNPHINENSKVYSIDVADMVDVLSSWDKGEAGYTDGNSYMGKKGKAEPFYYSQAGMHVSGGIKDALKALTKMWKKLDVKPATTIKIFKAYHKLPDSKKKFSNPDFWEAFLEKNGITVVAESVNEAKYKGYDWKRQNRKDGHPLIVPALQKTFANMKDLKKYIDKHGTMESVNERFRPSDRKVLLVIGRDVVKILNDKYHKGTLTPNKQLGQALNSIFRAMTRDESDANHKQYKKYFPKYNTKLLRRLTKAYFDEPVNVQNTFIKHVMKYALGDSK